MRHFENHQEEVSKAFNLNGFIHIPNLFSGDEIANIIQATNRYIDEIAPY